MLVEIDHQADGFKKVIEFAGFLLESIKKTKVDLVEQIN